MKDKQEFKIRVRQYASGEVFSATHHEMEKGGIDFDEYTGNIESAYREFDLEVSATPPADEETEDVAVDVPDDAECVSVDVPDPAAIQPAA